VAWAREKAVYMLKLAPRIHEFGYDSDYRQKLGRIFRLEYFQCKETLISKVLKPFLQLTATK
jgi:hypothetical protein